MRPPDRQERLPPPLDDFLYICEDAYARREIIATEMKILRTVNFDVGLPVSYRFLRRYARVSAASRRRRRWLMGALSLL